MSAVRPHIRLDRYTRISELGDALHLLLNKGIPVFGLIIAGLVLKLFFSGSPGWLALLLIGAGTCIALLAWKSRGIGLPLLPLLAVQHFAIYGLPIFNRNEVDLTYPESLIDGAGLEVFIMLTACAAFWRFGMELFRPSQPVAHALRVFATEGNKVLNRIGIMLISVSAGYQLLDSLHLLDTVLSVLPNGTQSIVVAIIGAAGMSGYFLVAMFIASGGAHRSTKNIFWVILTFQLILITSTILLSSVMNIIGAVVIGLFWGSGRVPRIFLLISALSLSLLNVGKFDMRERYWGANGQVSANVTIPSLPSYYWEWLGYSADQLFGTKDHRAEKSNTKQTMLVRMDNMQNLLFVCNRVVAEKTPVLGGATYTIIPPLLIPRIFWPEKPRTHEGQIMLNLYYGRQTKEDSVNTYVAWGLLPEAYGNFGPIWGALVLGSVLGLIFAWVENATATKPLLSLEGLVTFVVLIGIATSFEMVSSVLVTSLFQSVVTVSLACMPFVKNMIMIRPAEFESV